MSKKPKSKEKEDAKSRLDTIFKLYTKGKTALDDVSNAKVKHHLTGWLLKDLYALGGKEAVEGMLHDAGFLFYLKGGDIKRAIQELKEIVLDEDE